jgi:hypothetical protein
MTIKVIHLSSVESVIANVVDDTREDYLVVTLPYEIIPQAALAAATGVPTVRLVEWGRGVKSNSNINISRSFILYETDEVEPKVLAEYLDRTSQN